MHALLVATALLATVAFVALRPVGGSRAATTRHPPVVAATRFHTRWPIKHVVFVLKENRSFDHMFGTFPGAAGATTGLEWGKTVPLTKTTDQRMIDADNLAHSYRIRFKGADPDRKNRFRLDAL